MANGIRRTSASPSVIEFVVPWLVLAFLLAYTYATFFLVPYVGFDFNPSTGEVMIVFAQASAGANLQPGDRILRVNSVTWEETRADTHRNLFEGVRNGETLALEVLRGGRQLAVQWKLPSITAGEFIQRFINVWLLAYAFWGAGTATLLSLRPKDTRWLLFVAFYYLTAAWLITGNLSRWRIWESSVLLRSFVWLSVPVYLHLHWIFPKPLGKMPKALLMAGYLIAIILAIAEWFNVLPSNIYALGFMLAILGSAIFLLLHFIRQPIHRREAGLMGLAVLLTFVPLIGIGLARLINEIPNFGGIALLGLLALPLIYFYAVFSRQLGGLELRANRLITLYLFFLLGAAVFVVLVTAANTWLVYPGAETGNGVMAALLGGVITAVGYTPFRRFVERYLLRMPLPPEHLLQIYTSRITTSLDRPTLVELLKEEVLPSLLVRQSALLHIGDGGQIEPLFVSGVDEGQLPSREDIPALENQAAKARTISYLDEPIQSVPWIRLVLPLKVDERLIGFWLFGRRPPDDYYAQSELPTLQTLASQVAIALVNIIQAEHLHAIYQADIERQEAERARLARGLHDEVLNELTALALRQDGLSRIPGFQKTFELVSDYLRAVINDLRPTMITYGLRSALIELIDQLSERVPKGTVCYLDIPDTDARYDPDVELYLFRIVQQACENALRHSNARNIRIHGQLGLDSVRLVVEDDGVGFPIGDGFDLNKTLAARHYGLVGMYERSTIIDARLSINSEPGQGTRVEVVWPRG